VPPASNGGAGQNSDETVYGLGADASSMMTPSRQHLAAKGQRSDHH
jgi:hypothetical protein